MSSLPPRVRKLSVIWLALQCALAAGCKMVADGQNMEGVRLVQQGQDQQALARFQQAITSDPKNADAYYNMGATYHRMASKSHQQQLFSQAEILYNQCLDLNEDHVECRRGLAVLLVETGRSDRAFDMLKNWANARPQSADARIELARLYEEFGDTETAKLNLQQAITLDHNNARAWVALGKLRENMGDHEQALANYQRAYGLNSFQPALAQRISELNRTTTSVSGQPPPAARIVSQPVPGTPPTLTR